jgi:hypothetical protein
MEYVEINTGPWDDEPDSWWVRLFRRVLPAANPDFEETLYPNTRIWWIELDCNRIPQREIGFNEEGDAIILGPVGRNYGYVVDSPLSWPESYEQCEEASRSFQKVWDFLWPRFAHPEEKESQQDETRNHH